MMRSHVPPPTLLTNEIPPAFESCDVTNSHLFYITCVDSNRWELSLINFILSTSITTSACASCQSMCSIALIRRQVVPQKYTGTANQIPSCESYYIYPFFIIYLLPSFNTLKVIITRLIVIVISKLL